MSGQPSNRDALLRIAHDLNNVLTVLSGELQLLESEHPRAEVAGMREAIARGIELTREIARVA
jgi:signal transduction histidine kinase